MGVGARTEEDPFLGDPFFPPLSPPPLGHPLLAFLPSSHASSLPRTLTAAPPRSPSRARAVLKMKYSANVTSSRRKARKAYFTSDSESRRVLMSAHLDKELRQKHGVRPRCSCARGMVMMPWA